MEPVIAAAWFVYSDPEVTRYYDSEDGVNYGGNILDSDEMAYELCDGDVTDAVLAAIADTVTDQTWTTASQIELPLDQALKSAWDRLCDELKYRTRFVFLVLGEETTEYTEDFTAGWPLARSGLRRAGRVAGRFGCTRHAEIDSEAVRECSPGGCCGGHGAPLFSKKVGERAVMGLARVHRSDPIGLTR